jgi:hypothetical protein
MHAPASSVLAVVLALSWLPSLGCSLKVVIISTSRRGSAPVRFYLIVNSTSTSVRFGAPTTYRGRPTRPRGVVTYNRGQLLSGSLNN